MFDEKMVRHRKAMCCEQCGAVGWGNLMCLACLRYNKRLHSAMYQLGYFPDKPMMARILIKMAVRKIGAYAP
jgi:hypothetical protein